MNAQNNSSLSMIRLYDSANKSISHLPSLELKKIDKVSKLLNHQSEINLLQ